MIDKLTSDGVESMLVLSILLLFCAWSGEARSLSDD